MDARRGTDELALRVPNPATSPATHNLTASQFDTSTTKVCYLGDHDIPSTLHAIDFSLHMIFTIVSAQ